MMTLVQWQQTRRVDHVNLGVANPRYRGQSAGLRNLKVFDADVARFWGATNAYDRVDALALIYGAATAHIHVLQTNNIEQRYINAVTALQQSAQAELNQIWSNPNAYNAARRADISALAARQALAAKNVALNIFYLAQVGAAPALGPIDATINTHIANANNAPGYQRAQITFARANANATVITQTPTGQWIVFPQGAPANIRGKFAAGDASGAPKLIAACNAQVGAANSIDIVYLDDYDEADVQGKTFQPHKDYGSDLNTIRPTRPIVTITRNPPVAGGATYPTTLAHELGHALTAYSDHSNDGNNLMAAGANRNGADRLGDGQIAWFRNNAYT